MLPKGSDQHNIDKALIFCYNVATMSRKHTYHNQSPRYDHDRGPLLSARRKTAALFLSGITAGAAFGIGAPQMIGGEASAVTVHAKGNKAPKIPNEITVDGVTMKVYNPKSKEALRNPEAYDAQFEAYAQGDPKKPYRDVDGKVIPTGQDPGSLGQLYAKRHALDSQEPGTEAVILQLNLDHGNDYIYPGEVVYLDRTPEQS